MVVRDPRRLTYANARSNIGCMEMYCTTLVWRQEMYPPIISNPIYASASTTGMAWEGGVLQVAVLAPGHPSRNPPL